MQELRNATAFLDQLYARVPLRQRLWHVARNNSTPQLCKQCESIVQWTEKTSEYRTYCSSKCAHNSSEVKEKTQQTCLSRYGESTNLKTQHTKDKIEQTCIQKYGTRRAASSDQVKSKIKAAFEARYGTNPSKLVETQARIDQTHFARYGRKRQSQEHLSTETIALKNNADLMREWYSEQKMPVTEIAEALGVSHSQLCVHFKNNLGIDLDRHSVSRPERELREFAQSLGVAVEFSNRQLIAPQELDIVFPDHNFAIEFDGLAWHCESRGKTPRYHADKTDRCRSRGVQLIHVTDYEWENQRPIVESRIRAKLGQSQRRIYARRCEAMEITARQANEFAEATHIQGACVSRSRYGLFCDSELVAVMTFGKARYSKKAAWELLRYSTALNTTVVGGASRLLAMFVRLHPTDSIISYSDLRWNSGNLYQQLGFAKIATSGPNYWYSRRYRTFESRVRYQKHKLKDLLEQFDPTMTEWANMSANGYDRYWDCGNSVWLRSP